MDEKYNGWSNRETWAYSMHIGNDEGMYNELQDAIKEIVSRHIDEIDDIELSDNDKESAINDLEKWLKDYLEQLKEMGNEFNHSECKGFCIHDMIDEIGSDWRIDFHEIAENEIDDNWNEALKEKKESDEKLFDTHDPKD